MMHCGEMEFTDLSMGLRNYNTQEETPYSLMSLDLGSCGNVILSKICHLHGIEKKHFYTPCAIVSMCSIS